MSIQSIPGPFLVLFLAAPLSAAEPALTRYSYAERHMGTRFQILLYAADEATANRASRAAFARIAELDNRLSDYKATSELMRLCAKAGGAPVHVCDDLFRVLEKAQKVARLSDGAFDVTVGPLVRLWRQSRRTLRLPVPEKLAQARMLVGYRKVRLDASKQTVQLEKKGMRLDLGGIAKGFTADEVLKVLRKHGITRALVAAGGDIAVGDAPPGTAGWKVAILPLGKGDPATGHHLVLANAAVSTSGDTEQFVEIDGKRYSHIVDPRTGLGLVGRMHGTVVARHGIDSDSLTKVVTVLGEKKGLALIEGLPGVSARLARRTDKGLEIVTTKKFPKMYRDEK